MIIKGFVKGDDSCNYELYLTELINASYFFRKKLHDGCYVYQKNQSHSEPDCVGNGYEIDFKLMESKTMLQAKNIFTPEIETPIPGVRIISTSKSNPQTKGYKPIEAVILYKAIRNRTLQELKHIEDKLEKKSSIDDEITHFLKKLKTQKNILLFLPYVLSFDCEHQGSSLFDDINHIVAIMSKEFEGVMQYRRSDNKYDTYMTFLFENTFIILERKEDCLKYVECINKSEVPTYCHLSAYQN